MEEESVKPRDLTMSNTKKEMMDTYNELLKKIKEKEKTGLKPEKKIEEKKKKDVVGIAETLSLDGVVNGISNLKLEIGKRLTNISDGLEEEVNKFQKIQNAIEVKEEELRELYEIEKSAESLAALIESQNIKRGEFESQMAVRRLELEREIQAIRADWEKDKKSHEALIKERDLMEVKSRERDKEEYKYSFKREQQLAKDAFEDERKKIERANQLKKEQMEKEFSEREKIISERETEFNDSQKRIIAFPKEMEEGINKAVKEATEKIKLEAKNREDLVKKEFDGERNVLTTKIQSLEKNVKEQGVQIVKLSEQLENAYQKVQDIAAKSVEGSSNTTSLANLQQFLSEQSRKQQQEK
jgi:hypothetical protein